MEKLYQTKNLLDAHGGDQEFLKYVVSLFIEHVPAWTRELNKACLQANWEQVYFWAHKLKPTIDLFEIKEAHLLVRSIENNARSVSHIEQIPDEIGKISQLLKECTQQLQNEFKDVAA